MGLFRYQRFSMLILAVLLLPHFGQSRNPFRKGPQETYYVKEGDDIEIPCVTDDINVKCHWSRNGQGIFPNINPGIFYQETAEKGDCSLKIKGVSVSLHNGTFECQLPSYIADPGYKGLPTSLIVVVKPRAPKLDEDSLRDIPADRMKSLKCLSFGGNPLPSLEWYLNNENITASASTTVKGESVTSTLNYAFKKQNNRGTLTCVSVHRLEKQITKKVLDVTYRPIVSVDRRVFHVDDKQNLTIECQVDANPPAQAIWKPSDNLTKNYNTNGSMLILSNVRGLEMDGKEFQCSSMNRLGSSEVATIILSVSYPARVNISSKTSVQNVPIGGELELFCDAKGNPKPTITWIFVDSVYREQHNPRPADPSKLIVHNISYLDEGEYYCEAENKMGDGTISQTVSDKLVVGVSGKPQFLSPDEPVIGYKGDNVLVEAVFCSDPPPTRVEWKYDSIVQHKINPNFRKKSDEGNLFEHLEDGIHIKAGPLVPIDQNRAPNHTCFKTMLLIVNTDIADAKEFTVMVENENDRVEKVILLQVYNQMSGAMILSISLIALLMLFVLTILFIFFLRRRSADQQGHDDCEDKSDSHVPIHNSDDDAAKQATIEKVL